MSARIRLALAPSLGKAFQKPEGRVGEVRMLCHEKVRSLVPKALQPGLRRFGKFRQQRVVARERHKGKTARRKGARHARIALQTLLGKKDGGFSRVRADLDQRLGARRRRPARERRLQGVLNAHDARGDGCLPMGIAERELDFDGAYSPDDRRRQGGKIRQAAGAQRGCENERPAHARPSALPRNLPNPVTGLLLDLDGTLVDTEHLHFETAIEVLARQGVGLHARDLLPYVGWAELPFWQDLKRRFNLRPPAEDLLLQRSDAYLLLLQGRRIEPLPGVAKLLAWAAAQGLPMAVASSSPQALIAASLEAAGLREWIQVWRSGHEDAARGKPEPDVYHAAAAALGIAASSCVALEDSPTGARAARASGAFTIGLPCPSHPAAPESLAMADLLLADAGQALDFLRARARLAPPNTSGTTSPKRST